MVLTYVDGLLFCVCAGVIETFLVEMLEKPEKMGGFFWGGKVYFTRFLRRRVVGPVGQIQDNRSKVVKNKVKN